jgi:hypothetical protein
MVLAEVLVEMSNLKQKIEQLEDHLYRTASQDTEAANMATSKLLNLLDKHRSYLILINKVNNDTEVSIGDQKVSLANAILITKTIYRKVDLLNSLIEGNQNQLDVFDLMEQRDKLLDEYTTISNGLKAIEWRTKVD